MKPATKLRTKSEAELASQLIPWLTAQGWDIWQEIRIYYGGPRADIVAMQSRRSWVIEVKRTASWELVDQANNWTGYANFVSIAFPKAKGHISRSLLDYARLKGFGIIVLNDRQNTIDGHPVVYEAPRLRRATRDQYHDIRTRLTPETKGWGVAGEKAADYWTPYKETCRKLRQVVETTPGISMKEAMAELKDHHYSSDQTARSSLMHWGRIGRVPGVEFRTEGRFIRLYPRAE